MRDPWSQHAVAHVLMATNSAAAGVGFLQPLTDSWSRCSSFMFTHNWWHLALFQLELNEFDAALKLYDQQVWSQRKGHVHDQVNAISLLLRLEARGADVGDRWAEVAAYAALNKADQLNGFVDLHMLYALVRNGDTESSQAMWSSIQAEASNGNELWGGVMIPAAEAFMAHAAGDYAGAANILSRHRGRLSELGGSTIQQQWYDEIIRDRRLGNQAGTKVSA